MAGTIADIPGVITRADEISRQKSLLADAATTAAVNLAGSIGLASITVPTQSIDSVAAPDTPADLSAQINAEFDAAREAMRQELITAFSGFFSTYFPLGTELSAALNWVSNTIVNGGSGIDVNVENALWNRDRDRLFRDQSRQEDELVSTWAARRYPLPPGAAVHQLQQIRSDTADKVADSSRSQAIKAFEAELDNIKFAVGQAITARTAAMQAAADYIRTLAIAPQVSVQYATAVTNARMKAQELVMELYNLNLQAAKTKADVTSTSYKLQLDAAELQLKSQVESVKLAAEATMAAAQSLGTQAAAALNAIHANVGWNLSDSRDLTGTF